MRSASVSATSAGPPRSTASTQWVAATGTKVNLDMDASARRLARTPGMRVTFPEIVLSTSRLGNWSRQQGGVTQISWSGVGGLIDPPAEEVEQPLLHSNAMPSCASANRDHQQSWATPRQQGQSGNSALVVAPRAGADRTDVPQERLKARGAARAPMESSNATTGHASRQPPKTHDKDQISGVSIMSIVKCPPAQRIPMSGAWYSPIQAMSAMMSVSPDT